MSSIIKILDKSKILKLNEVHPENSQYKIIYIDVVHRCNMECANCYLPNRDYEDIPVEKINSFVDKFTHKTEFRLIGGEPTLHNDLAEIIRNITQNPLRHRVVLVTNGLKLASYKYLKSLTLAGLKYVYISMNGFDNDEIYKKVDNLACAKIKMLALHNCQKENMVISIGFIIIKYVNEYLISEMKNYFKNYKQIINFEFRNIGTIGRNAVEDQNAENYEFDQIKEIIFKEFQITDINVIQYDQYSMLCKTNRFFIHLHNWTNLPKGFDKKTNERRGRMTENFLVSPFLEHIVKNEGFY
jgi:molybdenum cofactor biosynthesis enzyme MoaA